MVKSNATIEKRSWYILALTVFMTYLLMVMGTFVTSTGSGLACPDWPLCYGSVSPPARMAIWFEWGHRLLGGFTGILILWSTYLVWKGYTGLPRRLTFAVLALLASAVLLGGVIVRIEAPLLTGFIHTLVISSHLIIATLVLICLVFTLRYVARSNEAGSKGSFGFLFIAVYAQIVLGILVRYSGASLACADFPLCNGALVPSFDNNAVILQFIHRLGAFFVFSTALVMLYKAIRAKADISVVAFTFCLIVSQAAFGILIVLSGMYLPFIIGHGAIGFFLLGWLAYRSMPTLFNQRVSARMEA
ncbi:MAG: heme A synthase [Deltaproteobacteria bacterium]|nr:heme A synthase [Deltaproteobacteria bacterium]